MSFSDPNINNNKEQNDTASYNFVNRKKDEGMGLVQLLLTIITVFAVLIAGGLFGYATYLKGDIDRKKQALAESEKKLQDIPLGEIKSLSARLKMANDLINNHQNVGSLFNILEKVTDTKVSYNNFNLSFDETKKKYNLSLSGSADGYETIIRQIDVLKLRGDYFSNVDVRSVSLNKDNGVDFNLGIVADLNGQNKEGKDKITDNKLFNFNSLIEGMFANTSTSTTANASSSEFSTITATTTATSTSNLNIKTGTKVGGPIIGKNK